MTSDEQLQLWLQGKPVHNHDPNECCPDFSCCQPQLLAPLEVREAFVVVDDSARDKWLMHFLSAAFAEMGKEASIYIAGREPEDES